MQQTSGSSFCRCGDGDEALDDCFVVVSLLSLSPSFSSGFGDGDAVVVVVGCVLFMVHDPIVVIDCIMVWLCFNRGEEEVIAKYWVPLFWKKGLGGAHGLRLADEELSTDNAGSCRVIVQMHAPHTRYTLIQKRCWLHHPMVLLHTYSNIYQVGLKYKDVPGTRSKILF